MNTGTLLAPARLWTRAEVLITPSRVPASAGIYTWWFRSLPPGVSADGCLVSADATLLYTGISPKAPPLDGRPPSKQNLRKRLRSHYRGNASQSTLRLTLGSLLSEQLGITLRRVGSGGRLTFTADGEAVLSNWMHANALVAWHVTSEPWVAEASVIATVPLPLNLDQNRRHPFHPSLTAARANARSAARSLPLVPR